MANGSILRTSNTVITGFGVLNQFHGALDATYVVRLDTTINFKRKCFPDLRPTKIPVVRYFGIGINGFVNTDDANMSEPYLPSPQNLDLYEPIPFRCIPVDEDEAFAAEREAKGYRMRVKETINGQQYWCYYLKKIEWVDTSPKFTMVDGDDHEIPYEIDSTANLSPTPSRPTDTSIINASTNRIIVSMNGIMTILGSEVSEVVNLKYGNARRAMISEIGTYTGEERQIRPEQEGGDIEYMEAVYVQLASHRCWRGQDMSDPSYKHVERQVFENGSCILV